MSIDKNTRSATSPLKHVHGVLGHLLRDFALFPALIFNILFRPTRTSSKIIHNNPDSLFHALKFYSEMFTLSFMIGVAASQFKLFEDDSEWRGLVFIVMQLLIATPIIYVLAQILPEKMPFSNVMQAMFYVDGAFILILAVASIPISYLDFTLHIPAANRELDIFATEYERCLAHHSILYRAMRGEIQFFLYIDRWKPQDWANWLFDNYHYVLAAPFLPVFAFMLRPKRKISFVLVCVFTAIAYAAAVEGSDFIKRRTNFLMAANDPECTFGFLDQVIDKYAPNLIARQLVYKFNNQSSGHLQLFATFFELEKDHIVFKARLRPEVEPTWQLLAQFDPLIRRMYCFDNDPYWIAARRINYNLHFVMYDNDQKTLLHQQLITPKDCPAWPAN